MAERDAGPGAIRIANFEFKPQKVVVKPGTKVTWTNADSSIHDIKDTQPAGHAGEPVDGQGRHLLHHLWPAGDLQYVCGIHPYMTGSVEVVP